MNHASRAFPSYLGCFLDENFLGGRHRVRLQVCLYRGKNELGVFLDDGVQVPPLGQGPVVHRDLIRGDQVPLQSTQTHHY